MLAHNCPESLPDDVERSAFIAKQIAPTARSGGFAAGVLRECNRPRARNRHDSRFARSRSGERDHRIVRDHPVFRFDQFVKQSGFVCRSTAHPETDGFEAAAGNACACSSLRDAFPHHTQKFRLRFRGGHVVARTRGRPSDNLAVAIADHRRGARLAAIHSQKIFAH